MHTRKTNLQWLVTLLIGSAVVLLVNSATWAEGFQGRAVRNLSGGYMVRFDWDAAPAPDTPDSYPRVPCFGAERSPSDIRSEKFAARLAQLGWDGIMSLEANWFEPSKAILARTDSFRKAVDLLKRKGMTENFLLCCMTYVNGYRPPANPAFGPKFPDWNNEGQWRLLYDYFHALGRLARAAGTRGVALDIEQYSASPFDSKTLGKSPELVARIRSRGYDIGRILVEEFPDMWLIILPSLYLWDNALVKGVPALAVPFCEGLLTAFAEKQKDQPSGGVCFGSEWTYGPCHGAVGFYGQDMSPAGCRKMVEMEYKGIRSGLKEVAKKFPAYFEKRVSLAAGIWPLDDYLGDEGSCYYDRYSAGEFANMLQAAKPRCPRYLWIYTQAFLWYNQNWDDYYRVLKQVHARPEYYLYEAKKGGSTVPARTLAAKTSDLSCALTIPEYRDCEFQLEAQFKGQKISGFDGKVRLESDPAAWGDDFSAPKLNSAWQLTSNGIEVKQADGRLAFSGKALTPEASAVARLTGVKLREGAVMLDLGGYWSDGEPIGGTASVTLYANPDHWFRLERKYDKISPRWSPDEKRFNNGFYVSLKEGNRQEAGSPIMFLALKRTIPLELAYAKGKVRLSVGEQFVREYAVNLVEGFHVELGAAAPKGVQIKTWFDNLILEGKR